MHPQATEQCLVFQLISQCEQSLSAQTPALDNPAGHSMAQHGTAWQGMVRQALAVLVGPKGKNESRDRSS
ncbi:unnamed protein product [Pleuronectes platessa]|uniref:Uncharacterized protein n=1 Tax=Pleuronectes platessa TaxID=8262 RepID=A0A9N7VRI2_PLEPL|nr:unnamed protein product [Pleuronectes platessa]